MSEEEKKAIEQLKYLNNIVFYNTYKNYFEDNMGEIDRDIKLILNLIQNQEEIIKRQSYTNKKMKKKLDNYRHNYRKYLNKNKKQEKVIDEMAKALHLYFLTNDEKIMITHSPKENCHSLSTEEIKQYFYRKVENNE